MNATNQKFLTRLNALIEKAATVQKTKKSYGEYVDDGAYSSYRAQALTCIIDMVGLYHPYTQTIDTPIIMAYKTPDSVNVIRGVLQSLKDDLENGYLQTVRELVHAEVFIDFTEIAENLLAAGYKDAAAVIIGSVLEQQLRQLASKNNVPISHENKEGKLIRKTADALNAELVKAGVYLLTNQKQVTAWLDIRNNAAHGEYQNYTGDQVALMVQGIIGFLAQFPA